MAHRLSQEDWSLLVLWDLSAGRPPMRAAPRRQAQDQFGLTFGASVPIVYANQRSGLQIPPDPVFEAPLSRVLPTIHSTPGSLATRKVVPVRLSLHGLSALELADLAAKWPANRLIEGWNGIPGLTSVKKFSDRKSAVSRIWKAIQSLDAAAAERPQRPPNGPTRRRQARRRARRPSPPRRPRLPRGNAPKVAIRRPRGSITARER
jgi:hypothetical protein